MTTGDVNFPIELDVIGVAIGAVAGALFGASIPRITIVGMTVFAFVEALGGAALRDALMGAGPTSALSAAYLITWAAATLAAVLVRYIEHRVAGPLKVVDGLYLGVWTVAGADKAIHAGLGLFAAIFLGVITGTAGSLFRDMLAGRIPSILQTGPLRVLASLAGSVVFVVLHFVPGPRPLDASIAIALIFGLRMLSERFHWHLPAIRQLPEPQSRQRTSEHTSLVGPRHARSRNP